MTDTGTTLAGTWASRNVPTILVLAVLGGVALWGHRTGWKASRFSEVFGKSSAGAEKEGLREDEEGRFAEVAS